LTPAALVLRSVGTFLLIVRAAVSVTVSGAFIVARSFLLVVRAAFEVTATAVIVARRLIVIVAAGVLRTGLIAGLPARLG
jgi:hypothetical protein